MTLDYQLSPRWISSTLEADLASPDDSDFRYSVLLGDIILKDDSCDLSACWGWVPVVDFAAALWHICNDLSQGDIEVRFDFTESEAEIVFKRAKEKIVITTTYAPGSIMLPYDQLVLETKAFARRMKSNLVNEYPQLAQNAVFVELLGFAQ